MYEFAHSFLYDIETFIIVTIIVVYFLGAAITFWPKDKS